MNKLRLYGIWSLIIIVMFFILMSSALGAEKEPIKIGVIISLTGEAAEMGIENKRTIDVAVDLLNAKALVDLQRNELRISSLQQLPHRLQ